MRDGKALHNGTSPGGVPPNPVGVASTRCGATKGSTVTVRSEAEYSYGDGWRSRKALTFAYATTSGVPEKGVEPLT